MGLALAKGDIDAFLSGEPFPSMAVSNGVGRILSYPYYGDSIGTINAGMLVKRRTIEKDPELVYSLVAAHAAATEHLSAHPEKWLEKASTFGTSRNVLEKAAHNMELAWKMDQKYIQRVKALGERMERLGVIRRQPDYDRLFDLSFVNRVKRER
jgi:NitT/TauT family transport system substrate-binding protein